MYAIVIKRVEGTIELNGPYATEEQANAGIDRLVKKLDEDMEPVSAVRRFQSGAVGSSTAVRRSWRRTSAR
jgi:hypothetical protein